jgi:hypothetical protein
MSKPALKKPAYLQVHAKDSFDRARLPLCVRFSVYYKAGRDTEMHKSFHDTLPEARKAEAELLKAIPKFGHRPVIYGILPDNFTSIYVPDDYEHPAV